MKFHWHETINESICDGAGRPGGHSGIIGVPGYTVRAGLGSGLGGGAMWRSSVGWRGVALRRFDARSAPAEVSGGARRRRSAEAPITIAEGSSVDERSRKTSTEGLSRGQRHLRYQKASTYS